MNTKPFEFEDVAEVLDPEQNLYEYLDVAFVGKGATATMSYVNQPEIILPLYVGDETHPAITFIEGMQYGRKILSPEAQAYLDKTPVIGVSKGTTEGNKRHGFSTGYKFWNFNGKGFDHLLNNDFALLGYLYKNYTLTVTPDPNGFTIDFIFTPPSIKRGLTGLCGRVRDLRNIAMNVCEIPLNLACAYAKEIADMGISVFVGDPYHYASTWVSLPRDFEVDEEGLISLPCIGRDTKAPNGITLRATPLSPCDIGVSQGVQYWHKSRYDQDMRGGLCAELARNRGYGELCYLQG